MKRIAIIQSSYIPWKGYFDIISSVDEFILYDDVQYSKQGWRNRNRIKTNKGLQWLSIPVCIKGRSNQKIFECQVAGNRWVDKHWKSIAQNYKHAPYFKEYGKFFQNIYEKCRQINSLSQINYLFIRKINDLIGITTPLKWSMDYEVNGEGSMRLLNLCLKSSADEYLSGPAAKSYLDEQLFTEKGIRVSWINYDGYTEYDQRFSPPFVHELSIIDLIFNVGAKNVKNHFSLNPIEDNS